MTDVTLVGNDGVTFTFLPGEVNTVESQVTGGPEVQSIPGTAPANSFSYDLEGGAKVIQVSGQLYDTTAEGSRTSSGTTVTILQQKQWLEKQINGSQSLRNFTSNYESQTFSTSGFTQTKVLAGNIRFSEQSGNPSELQFSMRLLVGGT